MSTRAKTSNKKTPKVKTRKKKAAKQPETAKKPITTNTRKKKANKQPKTAQKAKKPRLGNWFLYAPFIGIYFSRRRANLTYAQLRDGEFKHAKGMCGVCNRYSYNNANTHITHYIYSGK